MNKLFPIVLVLLALFLISSCSFSHKMAYKGSKAIMKMKKIEKVCKKECKENKKSSNEWCDCMSFCSNSERIQDLVLKNHKGNLSVNRNGNLLIIKEDGAFQIEFAECINDPLNSPSRRVAESQLLELNREELKPDEFIIGIWYDGNEGNKMPQIFADGTIKEHYEDETRWKWTLTESPDSSKLFFTPFSVSSIPSFFLLPYNNNLLLI